MYERPRFRYRDSAGSRFFQAQRLSPEETWEALGRELARVLDEARRAFWRQPLHVDPDRIRWWHGAIFGRLFPHEGGRFRQGPAFFGVVMPDGGLRQLEGAPPNIVRRELAVICSAFNETVASLDPAGASSVLDRARAAASLYAGILRVHPFVDGNHRAAFVALSSALWSLGLPNIEFVEDDEMTAHDDALVPALVSGEGSIEPFTRLLAELIERSTAPDT